MKIVKRLLFFLLMLLFLGGIGAAVYYFLNNENAPETVVSSEADELAKKMLEALNYNALKKTRYLKWSFNQSTHYLYDQFLGVVNVQWDENEVELFLTQPERNTVYQDGTELTSEEEKAELISTAIRKFNNDSFWLLAPYKVFDEGTLRSIVELEEGGKGLMVEYTEGGDTPGDKYLWLLDERGFPYAYRMWVQILPIGGTEASWDDWVVTETGAFLPKSHKIEGIATLDMGDVQGFNNKSRQ